MWRAALRYPKVVPGFAAAVEGLRGQRHADLDAELARRLAQTSGRPAAQVARIIAAEIDGTWARLFEGAGPSPSVAALLAMVDHLGLPRAVVSDHPALTKLEAMGSTGWSAVVDCRSLGALKPLPDALHAAAAQLGVPVIRILHVGDRDETDGAMAAAAGAAYVGVHELDAGALPLGCPAASTRRRR